MSKANTEPADAEHVHAVVWIHAEAGDNPAKREIIALGRRRFGLD